jgi:hypothetical protein
MNAAVNLVKADSYISTKEEGEARLKHLISAFREHNNMPELNEDGSAYLDGVKRSDSKPKARGLTKSFIKKRAHHHHDGTFRTHVWAKLPVGMEY